jgi:transposase-like protein
MECKYCGSEKVIKYGKSQGKQCYLCKECNHKFVDNGNYAKMRTDKRIIVCALDMYFEGLSVRKIKRQIYKIFKYKTTQMAIWKWVKKYSELVKEYVDTLQLEHHSGEFHVDETVIKCKGKDKWFWEVIDGDTKFMLGTHLSGVRTVEDAKTLFRDVKMRIREKPKHVYVDGLYAYRKGFNKVFYDHHQSCKLIQRVGLQSRVSNNVVERLHSTLKDRLRPMRGIGEEETAEVFLKGWFVHYNFVRPHQSLDGKTPAEVSGINIALEDGWGDLIEKASEYKAIKEKPVEQIRPVDVETTKVGVMV